MLDVITVNAAVSTAAGPIGSDIDLPWVVLGAGLALLAVAGVWLVHSTGQQGHGYGTVLLCLSLAVVAFFAAGFALAMGGASGMYGGLGSLAGLNSEWMPRGEGWGLLGRQGFFLSGTVYNSGVYALFLFQVALLMLALVIALLPWVNRAPRLVPVLYSLLFAILLYPIFANWAWGGGWLANLGQTRNLGHGFVDFAGSGVVNAAAGLALLGALLGLRRTGDGHKDATVDAPHSLAGLALAWVGWIGIMVATAYAKAGTPLVIVTTNAFVAMTCAVAVGLLYTWFVAGEPYPIVGAQAGLAGLVAISAGTPFVPAWSAAVVGGVAGLLVPFGGYMLARLTGSTTGGSLIAVHGLGGIWGLLALGLMANGRYGMGWNGIGEQTYLGVVGLGVTGTFPGIQAPSDSGQLMAQLAGVGALLLFPIVTFAVVAGLNTLIAWWQAGPALPADRRQPVNATSQVTEPEPVDDTTLPEATQVDGGA